MSEKQPELPNRQAPFSDAFRTFIAQGWAPYPTELPERLPAADAAAERRQRLSELYTGVRLVIPAGGLKIRSNDTDYRFRPHSAFAYLTGLGTDREPDAVLIMEPSDDGHDATLFFKPRAPRDSAEFYSDARYGEMWVGRRPSLDEMSALCGIRCSAIEDLPSELAKNAAETTIRIVRETDSGLTAQVDELRDAADEHQATVHRAADADLAVALSELRLIKDAYEIDQMREACSQTAAAFGEVVAALPEAVRRGRGERWIEGIFGLHARHVGNAVGYDSIVACGDHANTLHWIRNDGAMTEGELLLLDAGVELDSLYTADVTRTLPVTGSFTDAQREIYDAVLEAQQAGIDAARAGNTFSEVHQAAIAVIARHLEGWGLLPISAQESLSEDGGLHRRWMVHGTSHHLGIDVHDCAQARAENYREGTLAAGMIITVEPGLYFKSDDELVPEKFRGIGVRIEDDVLITDGDAELLSGELPRASADLEAWMAERLAS